MRRHRNEKPFVCSVCGKGFVINFELSRHMRTVSNSVFFLYIYLTENIFMNVIKCLNIFSTRDRSHTLANFVIEDFPILVVV